MWLWEVGIILSMKVGSGTLTRDITHKCNPPGFWLRLVYFIKMKDIWCCDVCSKKLVWGGVDWQSLSFFGKS